MKLGGDRGYRPETPPDWRKGVPAASEARTRKANHAAHGVLPAIEEARRKGAVSLRQVAEALNAEGVKTATGAAWTATGVRRVLLRAEGGA